MSTLRTVSAACALVLAASLFALTALWLAACGGSGPARSPQGSAAATTTRSGAPAQPRHAVADFDGDDYEVGGDADDDDASPPYDRDGDSDGEPGRLYDLDDADLFAAGRPASARDAGAVRALVRRYFEAIAAIDGRTACSLMLARVAAHVPEVLGSEPRPPFVRGRTCPQIAASVFAFYGRQLRAEAAAVEVAAVRVHGASALAVLAFKRDPSLPLRTIELGREGRGWRIDGLLDNELP